MNKKLNYIFKKKKNYKKVSYTVIFIVIFFLILFFVPKFFNYTPKIIKVSLNKNSGISVKNISDINYKFFPSPRLRLSGSNLEFEENILKVNSAEIDIILKLSSIFNYKILEYKKILIKRGSSNIEIGKINKFFNFIKKNSKKIYFDNNNIIILRNNKKLFELKDSVIKLNTKTSTKQLNINGLFFNQKTTFVLENKSNGKIKISLRIPKLDISTNILLANKNNFKSYQGLVDIEIINNFFQFNLLKQKNIKIKKGFVRSSLTNTLFTGELTFEPYFLFNLDVRPSTLDVERTVAELQKFFFSEDLRVTEILKKIDGSLNFKRMFEGSIVFKNREVLFQNFQVGKNSRIVFNAKISEFGKKGKIQFNLITNIQNKKTGSKAIEISGYTTPSNLKIIFEKIIINKEVFTDNKIDNFEKKFRNEVLDNSFSNIFNEAKIVNFFKTFEN